MTTSAYSQSEIVKFTAATASNLKWWTHQGVIRADVSEAAGTGHHRRFSFLNLIESSIAVELNRYGVSLDAIRYPLAVIRFLAEHSRIDPSPAVSIKPGAPALENLMEYYRTSVRLQSPKILAKARSLGIKDIEDLPGWLALWRGIATPTFRTEFAFAGIAYHAEDARTDFIIQPLLGDLVFSPGRSALFVDLIPILNELEARTGDSLD